MSHLTKVRFLLLAGIAGTIALATFFLISTSNVREKTSPPPPVKNEGGTEVSIRDFHLEESEAGKMIWQIKADLAEKMREKNVVRLHNLELVLFASDGRKVTITGDEGLMDNENKKMTVSQKDGNPTRVLFDNGYLLTTTTLHWTDADKVAQTDDPVTLEGSNLRLTGTGMRAKLDTQQVEVKSNVKAVIGKR